MESHLSAGLLNFTSRNVKEISEEIKDDIREEYDYFFGTMVREIIGAFYTPAILTAYATWDPLSDKWAHYKRTEMHYVGLSNGQTRSRSLGRTSTSGASRDATKSAPRGRVKVGSFVSYIEALNAAGTTERFFGPVAISYDFISYDPHIRFYPKNKEGVLVKTDVRKKGKYFKYDGSAVSMGAYITAFGNLKGVQFDEWHIVDYIIKKIDPEHEKQWVKINSRFGIGRTRRPIRAIITPLVKYYMDTKFPRIVERAITNQRAV